MPAKSVRKHLFAPELPVACTGASDWLAGLFTVARVAGMVVERRL